MVEGRVIGISERLSAIEADMRRLDDKWQKSVDDIKATIRSEVSELKSEQIADLKTRLQDGYRTLEAQDKRLDAVEKAQDRFHASAGVVNWLIKVGIAIAGVFAGAFGWDHIRH